MNNKTSFSHFISKITSFLASTFGRVEWRSPPWMNALAEQAKAKPKQFWGRFIGGLLLVLLFFASYTWYEHRPKPLLITANITPPAITPLTEELVFQPLKVEFGYSTQDKELTPQPVAPLNALGKPVKEGIIITPAIKGVWRWENDHQLLFTPAEDWSAGQTYSIDFKEPVFAPKTRMEKWRYAFTTTAFQAKITDLKFYQDLVDPSLRQVVATVSFNFPVDPISLENHSTLLFQIPKEEKGAEMVKPVKLNFTYDKHKREAYLKSDKLQLPAVSRYITLSIGHGLQPASHTSQTANDESKTILIPDRDSFFKIKNAAALIVKNKQDQPEQVLNLEFSLGVTEEALNKALHLYLLPKDYPATSSHQAVKDYEWQNPGEVTANILALSKPLAKTPIPAESHFSSLHSYQFHASTPRYIYLKVDKGLKGFGDFFLNQDYVAVIKAPVFPKEIGFLHKGALLALSGEKKLSVTVRGLPAVKFEIARVLPENVNQLVTQTQGDFNNPYFKHASFNQQNISQLFSEIQTFNNADPAKLQYAALDLNKYLASHQNDKGPRGLFLLQATGWDPVKEETLQVKSSRLILITDLGLLVKDNKDKTHDVFVQSITTGKPVANATVSVLGKNGLPVLVRQTDDQGRVTFPTLDDFVDDREPVAYLANLNSDVSFIPYNNPGRQLNFSRFDVGGLHEELVDHQRLSAFVFTDRGIYRPGDEVHMAFIVKKDFVKSQTAGLPLQINVVDPRGALVMDQKFNLDASGLMSFNLPTHVTSPTGQYSIYLYIVKDDRADNLLGSTTFRVAEFQPDRMRINACLSQPESKGWISPLDLKAKVSLWNLYGAPATDRRISARMLLTPQKVAFSQYPDYIFADPLQNPNKPAKVFTDNLKDIKTNDQGQAEFNLHLERFETATYQLTFFAEGFEAEGGRSVGTQTKAWVSPLTYLLGYKPEGDLRYIRQNTQSQVHFLAVDPLLNPVAVNDLKIQLYALHPITTLVKKPDGTYQYQSIIKSTLLKSQPFSVSAKGMDYTLPSDQVGDFSLRVIDKENKVLSHLKFSVVGTTQVPLAQNAELTVKLNKTEYQAGEDIELQITAPYLGAGLMTIERDKVYAQEWFKTDTTSSVQKIHIPADFEGNGYLNIAFVRDWDSPELFLSPLSYSIVPFTVSHANQAVNVKLDTPELARPGQPLSITYSTDKPGKIIVFAVDEGILQVSNYTPPDPLAYFFQKRALGVMTQQTLDQILPKYLLQRERSAVGGDEGEALLASHLNPFKRKTELPVVYWSGILDTDSTPRQLQYAVPDYFSGSLKVMAVAVAADAVGAMAKSSTIKGHFVINPNLPDFVVPGDEFEVTASIANNVKDSGPQAKVDVNLVVSPGLEMQSDARLSLTIAEGREQTVRYKLRAKALLGSAKVTFLANLGDKSSQIGATLSIRPASPFSTSVISGSSSQPQEKVELTRNLYPEYRKVQVDMANSPLILVSGLQRYLDNFPYGCTEQLTSKAMPLLTMAQQPWFGKNASYITDKVVEALQLLGQRQMTSGAFSYWPGIVSNESDRFASIYAMHFVTEAKAQGYPVPNDLFYASLSYLKEIAAGQPKDLEQARLQAYAIYLLTRNELVTTNYLTHLQLYLDQHFAKVWQEDLTGAYLAATYQLLKSEKEARHLISRYKPPVNVGNSDFYSKTIANAQYVYLIANHFPAMLAQISHDYLPPLVDALNTSGLNTVLAGYTSLALGAYAKAIETNYTGEFSMSEILANGQKKEIKAASPGFQHVLVGEGVKTIMLNNPFKQPYFYQLTQAGFDKEPAAGELKQGLEIYREYRDAKGNPIKGTVSLGQALEVHIQVRTLENKYLNNMVIVDLLPGGFEVLRDSVSKQGVDFVDIREDRVIFFTGLSPETKEIVYKIKPTNSGKYTIPPIIAQSMYVPNLQASGEAGKIEVTSP